MKKFRILSISIDNLNQGKMADTLQIDALARSSHGNHVAYKGIDWLWSQDLQGGGYSNINQLQYDTQSVSNSGQYIVWSQAFLSIPYTITLPHISTDTAGAATFKAGYWNLVESLQISCQNKTVNNLCNKTNMAQSCRVLINPDYQKATYSLPTYGYTIDNPSSATVFSGTGTLSTLNLQNNKIITNSTGPNAVNFYSATGTYKSLVNPINTGLLDRVRLMNFQPDGNLIGPTFTQVNNVQRGISQFARVNPNDQEISGVAIIPLKYLSDFFSENNLGMPLHNLRMYLQVNINQGQFSFDPATCLTTLSTFPFQTIPIIITDAGVGNMTTAGTVKFQIGTYAGSATPTRLYYPTVELDAVTRSRLTFPLKKSVTYRDIQFFQLQKVTAGLQQNWQVSNAIPGLKRIFFAPMVAATAQISGLPSWANPISSVPGTLDPNMQLTNVSLQINTRQVWSNNILYEFEQFIEQMLPNRMNGDTSDYIAGSTLSEYSWLTANRWYIFDCSKVPSLLNVTTNTPVNLQIIATNNTNVVQDWYAWCEVETDVILESTPSSTYVQ